MRQRLYSLGLNLQHICTTSMINTRDRNEIGYHVAEFALPQELTHIAVNDTESKLKLIARGKARYANTATVLACMHAELLLDAIGIPLYPDNEEMQKAHAVEAWRYGRPAPLPGAPVKNPAKVELPLPLKERKKCKIQPCNVVEVPFSSDELFVRAHEYITRQISYFVDTSVCEMNAIDMLVSFLKWRKSSRAEEPFLIERIEGMYKASVLLPLPGRFGTRGGVGIGRSPLEARRLAAMHALDVLMFLGVQIMKNLPRQRAWERDRQRKLQLTFAHAERAYTSSPPGRRIAQDGFTTYVIISDEVDGNAAKNENTVNDHDDDNNVKTDTSASHSKSEQETIVQEKPIVEKNTPSFVQTEYSAECENTESKDVNVTNDTKPDMACNELDKDMTTKVSKEKNVVGSSKSSDPINSYAQREENMKATEEVSQRKSVEAKVSNNATTSSSSSSSSPDSSVVETSPESSKKRRTVKRAKAASASETQDSRVNSNTTDKIDHKCVNDTSNPVSPSEHHTVLNVSNEIYNDETNKSSINNKEQESNITITDKKDIATTTTTNTTSETLTEEEKSLMLSLEKIREEARRCVDADCWNLTADCPDGFIMVAPRTVITSASNNINNTINNKNVLPASSAASPTVDKNHSLHAIYSPREYDTSAKNRIIYYLSTVGRRFDDVFTIHHDGDELRSVNESNSEDVMYKCVGQLPLPLCYGDRIALGVGSTIKEATHLAAMHAELILDTLGVCIYSNDAHKQYLHAEACARLGRYAPIVNNTSFHNCNNEEKLHNFVNTSSPPPLRRERVHSLFWQRRQQEKKSQHQQQQQEEEQEQDQLAGEANSTPVSTSASSSSSQKEQKQQEQECELISNNTTVTDKDGNHNIIASCSEDNQPSKEIEQKAGKVEDNTETTSKTVEEHKVSIKHDDSEESLMKLLSQFVINDGYTPVTESEVDLTSKLRVQYYLRRHKFVIDEIEYSNISHQGTLLFKAT